MKTLCLSSQTASKCLRSSFERISDLSRLQVGLVLAVVGGGVTAVDAEGDGGPLSGIARVVADL